MKYILSVIVITFLVGGCDQKPTRKYYSPGCDDVPSGEPAVFCSGDSIKWNCVRQERYVNGKLKFHYSKDGCCDAIIETIGGEPNGHVTPITKDQIKKGLHLQDE